jgi:hypothetical protein
MLKVQSIYMLSREPSCYSKTLQERVSLKTYYIECITTFHKSRRREYPAHLNRCYGHTHDASNVHASDVRNTRRFRVPEWRPLSREKSPFRAPPIGQCFLHSIELVSDMFVIVK